MDLFLLRVHQKQVEHQCHSAIFAAQQAQHGLNTSNQELFWSGIQNLLTASANIAKAFWGQSGSFSEERRPLRESLGIEDNNAIANTALRNHLEHYDERLDRWYRTSSNHNMVDFLIGPANSSIGGVELTDIFRHYDQTTGDVIFWGEHFSMPELVAAINSLLPIVSNEANKPHWDVTPPAD